MKHYIRELTIHNGNNLKKLLKKNETCTLFICQDGQYQMVKNKLYKWTFPSTQTEKIVNYIQDYTLLSSEKEILDKNEIIWRIPYKHISKEIKKNIFMLHPKSQTSFVIEKCEGEIIDFYFESQHKSHQKTLKEDIISLLSYLK